jgi:hypothetical protein
LHVRTAVCSGVCGRGENTAAATAEETATTAVKDEVTGEEKQINAHIPHNLVPTPATPSTTSVLQNQSSWSMWLTIMMFEPSFCPLLVVTAACHVPKAEMSTQYPCSLSLDIHALCCVICVCKTVGCLCAP